MSKKLDSGSRSAPQLGPDPQLELALAQRECLLDLAFAQRECFTAVIVPFPSQPKPANPRIADAKRRLLEFASRLPD